MASKLPRFFFASGVRACRIWGLPARKGRAHKSVMALQLRPTCEHCNKLLPPASLEAMICSFECTFCRACVERVLGNVCPNCGGGFCPRPIRPRTNWKDGNDTGARPPVTVVTYSPVDVGAHAAFSAPIGKLPPEQR